MWPLPPKKYDIHFDSVTITPPPKKKYDIHFDSVTITQESVIPNHSDRVPITQKSMIVILIVLSLPPKYVIILAVSPLPQKVW